MTSKKRVSGLLHDVYTSASFTEFCWLFQAGIVGIPLQKIKRPIWQTTKHDPSSLEKKRVVKDFSAEEVIKLMEDEKVSAWCDKKLPDHSQ